MNVKLVMAFMTFLFFAISVSIWGEIYPKGCTRVMTGQLNQASPYVMHLFKVKTLSECVRACMAEHECRTFQFRWTFGRCYLLREEDVSIYSKWTGLVSSNVWDWNVGPCSGHTCAEDEYCHPTGEDYVCKKAYDVCYKHLPEKICFKHFGNFEFDLRDEPNLAVNSLVRNAIECVTFCATHQPTFMSLAYVANPSKCYCKNQTITEYFHKHHTKLTHSTETTDVYFKVY